MKNDLKHTNQMKCADTIEILKELKQTLKYVFEKKICKNGTQIEYCIIRILLGMIIIFSLCFL